MTTHPMPAASLSTAYASCRDLHRTHGRSYYLATRLLPAWKRRHVHALYGFTRYTDDIVDAGSDPPAPPQGAERARRLGQWAGQFYLAVDGLGYFILFQTRTFHHNEAFVAVLLLALLAVSVDALINWCIRRYMPWYRTGERTR